MAGIKQSLSQQVSRGESFGQLVILLIVIVGVAQFTNLFAAEPKPENNSSSSLVKTSAGAIGATGPVGAMGPAGADGQPGAAGNNGARGLMGLTGSRGEQGNAGANGSAGVPGGFSASYAQLSASSQNFYLETSNEWVPIPFDAAGAASQMTASISSPATITVQKDGVYQLSTSIYLTAQESDEGVFLQTNYRLGVKIGSDAIVPVSAIFASQAGEFLLQYSDIVSLTANETVQFYVTSSQAESRPFSNYLTILNSNAYLMGMTN